MPKEPDHPLSIREQVAAMREGYALIWHAGSEVLGMAPDWAIYPASKSPFTHTKEAAAQVVKLAKAGDKLAEKVLRFMVANATPSRVWYYDLDIWKTREPADPAPADPSMARVRTRAPRSAAEGPVQPVARIRERKRA